MKLDLQSEAFSATGNVTGQGARRTLGTPTLDALQILVRETAQNAWDARLEDGWPVTMRFHLRMLTGSQRRALQGMLETLPPAGSTREGLRRSLEQDELYVLEISDFGTSGLGGPVRADAEVDDGDRPDFVNFLRNIGSARDRRLGAGTYGYGKSASFRMSRCETILVYTQTKEAGRPVARFMGAGVGNDFEHRSRKYTGRHWWGVRASDRVVDPICGANAHRCAVSLGLERRQTEETGTSLLIIDPNLDPRSPNQVMNAIAETLLWFFWPKMMVTGAGTASMNFELFLNSESVPLPALDRFPPVEAFVAAMKELKDGKGAVVKCEKPIQNLGRIAFARTPRRSRVVLDTGSDRALLPECSSHVALMRPAELVVRYLKGPSLPSELVEYGGVFICDEDVEQHFADAEPPAHDDWIPDYLEGRSARTFVRVALRRIGEAAERFATPVARSASHDHTPVAAIADALGGVLLGQAGSRVGGTGRKTTGGTGRQKGPLRISQPEPFRFAKVRGIPCALFRLKVDTAGSRSVRLRATPQIVLEGGALLDVIGGDGPQVVGWLDERGSYLGGDQEVTVSVASELTVMVALSVHREAAMTVRVDSVP